MIEATWPLPEHIDELRELPVRRKGDWQGAGWLMAALVWLGYAGPALIAIILSFTLHPAWALLALANVPSFYVARVFMTRYHTVWFGTTYASSDSDDLDRVARRSGPHEGVHDWHQRHVPWYKTKYTFPVPVWRRHAEAAAYGLDVAQGRRTLENAAEAFCGFIYFQFMNPQRAALLISKYAQRWNREVGGVHGS